MLTEYGNVKVGPEWIVNELAPPLFTRVYYVCSGDVTCFCAGRTLKLKHGYLYLFPTAASYRLVQNPDDTLDCTFLHLIISPSLIPDVVEIDLTHNTLLRLLLLAFREAVDKEGRTVLESLSDILQIYLKEHGCFTEVSGEIGKVMKEISRCRNRMQSIEELSAFCGYHPQYFIRKFRKEVGMTPHQYMLHLHLQEAAVMLRRTEPVAQAAACTGFSDIKNFEKAFKGKYGMSPAKYKKTGGMFP